MSDGSKDEFELREPAAGEIDRRDFLKIALGTATVALLPQVDPKLLPDLRERPRFDPYVLEQDDSGYLFDPQFDYDTFRLPKRRVYHEWDRLSKKERRELIEDRWGEDPEDHPDIDEWLEREMEPEEYGDREFALLGPYASGIELYDSVDRWDAAEIGLVYVEGEHPGSSFFGVCYRGEVNKLNAWLRWRGYNLKVKENPYLI